MSYIKLCQITDDNFDPKQNGTKYIETVDRIVVKSQNLVFPMQVIVEIIDFGTQENFLARGPFVSLQTETVEVSAPTSDSIRYLVFNQLTGKYPSLVM